MAGEQTYPVFYQTQRMTLAQIKAKFEPGCHPEVWRCIEALLVWGKGRWGIGGGGRLTQPDKPGFAPAGMSFHEWQTFRSGRKAYSAFDLVMSVPGRVHRSPTWTEARELEQFGLWAFITGEPWHGQRRMRSGVHAGVQIRGWRTWVDAGRPDPDFWPLPGQPAMPPPPPLGGKVPYAPPKDWWLFPLNPSKPPLSEGMVDDDVIGHIRYVQDAIWHGAGGDIHRDGFFGPEMSRRVGDVQELFGLRRGSIGPRTWAAIDFLVARVVQANTPAAPPVVLPKPQPEGYGVSQASPCLYFVKDGDSPWSVGKAVYGSGQMGADLLDPALFKAPFVHIAIPQVAGFTTRMREGEGSAAANKRLGGHVPLDTFYVWNGGKGRMLHPGDVVHVPTA